MYTSLFIDESGDTGYTSKSTRFFIITAVCTDNIALLRRIARDVHKRKRSKKKDNMLHAYKETNSVRDKLIRELLNTALRCFVFILDKKRCKVKDPYLHSLEKMAKYAKDLNITHVCIAKRDTRPSYNKNIVEMFNVYNISVVFQDPRTEKALQITDFYSWCVFSHLEHSLSEYFLQIQYQIILI